MKVTACPAVTEAADVVSVVVEAAAWAPAGARATKQRAVSSPRVRLLLHRVPPKPTSRPAIDGPPDESRMKAY